MEKAMVIILSLLMENRQEKHSQLCRDNTTDKNNETFMHTKLSQSKHIQHDKMPLSHFPLYIIHLLIESMIRYCIKFQIKINESIERLVGSGQRVSDVFAYSQACQSQNSFKQIPKGSRTMLYEEGKIYKQLLMPLLTQWSIIAFDHGKLNGPGYKSTMETSYGNECGQVFVVFDNVHF